MQEPQESDEVLASRRSSLSGNSSAIPSISGETDSSLRETPSDSPDTSKLLPSRCGCPASCASVLGDRSRDRWSHESLLEGFNYPEVRAIQKIKEERKRPRKARELQRHRLGLWLVLVYSVSTIFTWTITCVLCYRPVTLPTYYDPGSDYTRAQYDSNDRWRRLTRVTSALVGSVTIPVTSAVCAKAAVVYCQKHSYRRNQMITMRQMIALADKGWSDIQILLDIMRPSTSRRTRSTLLIISCLLCGLGKNTCLWLFVDAKKPIYRYCYSVTTGSLGPDGPCASLYKRQLRQYQLGYSTKLANAECHARFDERLFKNGSSRDREHSLGNVA